MADPRAIHEFLTGEVEATTLLLGDFIDMDAQSGYTTYKASVSDIGEVILEDIEYTQDLQTTDKTIIGAINENKSVIGYSYDAYDATTAYATGDLCIYNNVLYKAKQATTGNLPTNTTYWEETSIADEIGRIDTELTANFDYTANETVIGDYFGYPLYRKYFDIGTLPNNTTKSVVVLDRHIRDLVNLRIVARTSAGDSFITIPYLSSNSTFNIECDVECTGGETKVNITTHNDRSGLVAFGIIEYLKPV